VSTPATANGMVYGYIMPFLYGGNLFVVGEKHQQRRNGLCSKNTINTQLHCHTEICAAIEVSLHMKKLSLERRDPSIAKAMFRMTMGLFQITSDRFHQHLTGFKKPVRC
jgi:hypothetical protein